VWNMAASLVQRSSLAHIARADSSVIAQPVRSPPAKHCEGRSNDAVRGNGHFQGGHVHFARRIRRGARNARCHCMTARVGEATSV